MNESKAPTEEEVKLANEAEMAKWQPDFTPEELGVKAEPKVEEKEEEKEEEEEPVVEDIEYTEPEPILTVSDPGEFKPGDYSFSVTVDGKTTKITSPEQAEEFADTNAEAFSAKDLIDFMRKANKMESGLENDKAKWESDVERYNSQSSAEKERQENISALASEIEYMISKGLLPTIAEEHKNANWSDPLVAKQPGVREQIELVNYMKKENDARVKAGVKPLSSMIDAFNAMKIEKGSKEATDVHERSARSRQAVGAKVSSVTPTDGAKYPKGIAVGDPNIFKRNANIWE